MKISTTNKSLKNVSTLLLCLALMITACSRGGDDVAADTIDQSEWKTYESHDALVEAAEKEGSLKVLTGLDDAVNQPIQEGFMKKYPSIKTSVTEGASDEAQKTILAIQADQVDFDVLEFSQPPDYPKFLPYIAPLDILKMVDAGTLDIPADMINPDSPNTVAFGSEKGAGVAWNKELVSDADVPSSYEGMLDPKYKGKFLFSVETRHVAALAETWGEARMLDWAKEIAGQDPVWTDSNTAGLTTMIAGEHPYFFMPHFSSVLRLQQEYPDKIGYKMLDPTPVHLGEVYGILKNADHPAAALLFFEYLASEEAQGFMGDLHPEYSSIFADKAGNDAVLVGTDAAITGWDSMSDLVRWDQEILDAWGFPTAEVSK